MKSVSQFPRVLVLALSSCYVLTSAYAEDRAATPPAPTPTGDPLLVRLPAGSCVPSISTRQDPPLVWLGGFGSGYRVAIWPDGQVVWSGTNRHGERHRTINIGAQAVADRFTSETLSTFLSETDPGNGCTRVQAFDTPVQSIGIAFDGAVRTRRIEGTGGGTPCDEALRRFEAYILQTVPTEQWGARRVDPAVRLNPGIVQADGTVVDAIRLELQKRANRDTTPSPTPVSTTAPGIDATPTPVLQ